MHGFKQIEQPKCLHHTLEYKAWLKCAWFMFAVASVNSCDWDNGALFPGCKHHTWLWDSENWLVHKCEWYFTTRRENTAGWWLGSWWTRWTNGCTSKTFSDVFSSISSHSIPVMLISGHWFGKLSLSWLSRLFPPGIVPPRVVPWVLQLYHIQADKGISVSSCFSYNYTVCLLKS